MLLEPRLDPPALAEVRDRLDAIHLEHASAIRDDLLVFYHRATLRAICALREYLLARATTGTLDRVDRWIRMVAVNRLTGHSPGFFSVYTLPPNQATSVGAQRKINHARNQKPPLRDVPELILRKTRTLLKDCDGATSRRARAEVGLRPHPDGPGRLDPGLARGVGRPGRHLAAVPQRGQLHG